MNERASQLNQPFIKASNRLISPREPNLFQHFVRLEVQALVETFKKGEILRLEFTTPKLLNYRRNRRVILAHCPTLEANCQNSKVHCVGPIVDLGNTTKSIHYETYGVRR